MSEYFIVRIEDEDREDKNDKTRDKNQETNAIRVLNTQPIIRLHLKKNVAGETWEFAVPSCLSGVIGTSLAFQKGPRRPSPLNTSQLAARISQSTEPSLTDAASSDFLH